jgi:cytochrome c peroxidase
MTIRLRLVSLSLAAGALACDGRTISDPPSPPQQAGLDAALRQEIGMWGPVPIGPVPTQAPAMVELGRALFFDRILSGNRDVSCATCHDPSASLTDGMRLAVGTGGTGATAHRVVGTGRDFVPRNAPSLLNQGIGHFYSLWDGRVNEEGGFGMPGGTGIRGPAGVVLPPGLTSILAAQAMLPVLNRAEMRGAAGDTDVLGNTNELGAFADAATTQVWQAVMTRLLGIQEYAQRFNAAYPGVPTQSLGFQHAANALAAFQVAAFTRTNTRFDRYLARDNSALTDEEKRGGILFFGQGQCASCHFGPLLGGNGFANIGVPQIGPGVGAAAPLDRGRGEHVPEFSFYDFAFRVPSLRNVELTAPYMHNGAYATLEQVVRHYTNADSSLRNYDPSQLPPELRSQHRGDAASIARIAQNLDGRVRIGIRLSPAEQAQIVAFLKSLTDPAARDLSSHVPASVPSGLPIR